MVEDIDQSQSISIERRRKNNNFKTNPESYEETMEKLKANQLRKERE